MRRELRQVDTGQALGSVELDRDRATFSGAAGDIFRTMRTRLGDEQAARMLVGDGWSNGYLYLAEPRP